MQFTGGAGNTAAVDHGFEAAHLSEADLAQPWVKKIFH
jgi:hypothetical protein